MSELTLSWQEQIDVMLPLVNRYKKAHPDMPTTFDFADGTMQIWNDHVKNFHEWVSHGQDADKLATINDRSLCMLFVDIALGVYDT